jgi:hypothetical protein
VSDKDIEPDDRLGPIVAEAPGRLGIDAVGVRETRALGGAIEGRAFKTGRKPARAVAASVAFAPSTADLRVLREVAVVLVRDGVAVFARVSGVFGAVEETAADSLEPIVEAGRGAADDPARLVLEREIG